MNQKATDILIIKPGNQKKVYGDLSDFNLTAIEPPLWASLLAGYMRGLGYSVALLDAEVEGWSHEEASRAISQIDPLLAVVSVSGTNPSASTMNMYAAGAITTSLKELSPGTRVMYHGLHPSALPERTLREEKTDYVCQGEGFYTIPRLIDAIKAGEEPFKVEGLWYRSGDEIVSNPRPKVIADLDQLPMPAWDLLPMDKYRAHNWHCFDDIGNRQPYGVLYTNLGCPYSCTFCCINAIFGKPGIRYRSPGKVIEELDFLVQNYGIRNIKIIDELFALKEDRVVEICDLIIERGYDLNMWAYARVNTVTPGMLSKMKEAGINWIAYGFESASRRVLENVNKKYDPDQAMKIVNMTYDAGLYIGANFILGLPEDDFDSMQDTLNLAMEINAEWFNIYATMAYPGSRLYDEAVKNGVQLPDKWEGYSPYSPESLPLPSRYLTPGEINSFRDYAFHAYFENPRYLKKIHDTFGIETVRHVQEMNRHRLKRNRSQFSVESR
jgi:anaerobic magnesium-protoporphyrin IX monomethyl ester cyclase